jgi:hypothetical protein
LQSAVPAEKAVFLASGGRWVVGRWGRPSIFVRIGSLGPRCPRFEFPGGDGEAAASSPLWNKFLQPRPCLAGDRSVSGKGSVGIGIPGSGVSAGIPRPGSFCTGVCRRLLRPRPVMQAAMVVSRFIAKDGAAAGSEACGCADLGASSIFWWRPQILGHGGGMGCVPGRWSSQVVIFSPSRVRCFCGSSQSFPAMVPSMVLGCGLRSLSGSGVVFYGIGSWQRRSSAILAGRASLWDFDVIFFFLGASLQVWLAQLCSVSFAYVLVGMLSLYVFLNF